MNPLKKSLIWYFMCSKRLLHKMSFIIILCLIPVIIPVTKLAMSGESGILKIAVAAQDNSPASKRAMAKIRNTDSIIQFVICDTESYATEMVKTHKADAAWVYKDNIEERITRFIKKESNEPFLKVIEREENVILQMSREMFYETIFDEVSFSLYSNYAHNNLKLKGKISDEELRKNYFDREKGRNIIEMSKLSSDAPVAQNHLISPIRGILSVLLILSGLAAAMYFLKDNSSGKFAWLPGTKRIIPAFSTCFSACVFSGTAILLSLLIGGFSVGFLRELGSMVLFIFSVSIFSTFFCILFKSYGKLGAVIPGIIVFALVLSPIFFNVSFFPILRFLLPTHYYLYSVYDSSYYLYFIMYSLLILVAVIMLNYVLNLNNPFKRCTK